MKKEKNKFKILKRVLPVLCSVLVVVTALITPISAVVNVSHREEQGNYDLIERSTFPLTVGLAFDIGDSTSIFTTSVGCFGQQNNASAGGSDSFDWLTTEQTSSTYLDGQLNYQLTDKITYSKQFYNAREGNVSNGYGTASIQPIKITVDGSTDLTQGLDCSSIVYKLKDVVINSSLIRKGNYVDNTHPDIILGGENEKDEFYSPDATDYRYLVPHVILPEISATAGYLGTYNVKATIVDQWGVSWELDYSVPIDTRGAETDTYIPFLPMSIFDSYGKEKGDRDYNIGMSTTVLLADYQSYLDLDYYEYKSIVPDTALIVDLNADVGGENTLVGRNYLDLGEYGGQTFNAWISSVDGNDGYTITGGTGGITVSYLDSDTGYTYTGTITDSNGATVYGTTTILADNEYLARLYRVMTTINVAGETFSVPSGITWEQFLNATYSRDMFRYVDFADGAGVQYKVADDRWSYVYENLGIYIQDDEIITDNGQYYLEGLTWFYVDNDRYLAPLNSTWEYFVDNEIYDKGRFRWTDFVEEPNGVQYNVDDVWYFVYYDNSIVQQTDTIIEEAHYFIPDKDKLALIGKWIPNPEVTSFNLKIDNRLITCLTNESNLIIGSATHRSTSGTVNTRDISFTAHYTTGSGSADDYIGLQLRYNNSSYISYSSGGLTYMMRYYLIDSIEFNNNIMDSRVILDPYTLEFMNTYFIKEGTATASVVEPLSASAVDVENSNSGIMLLASIPEDTDTMKWQKVEGTEYGRSAVFTLPLYTLTDVNENMVDSDVYSYPTFQKYITSVQKSGSVPTPQIDYTSWIGTATAGFLNMELMPNFSIGGVLAILIGFSIVMLFLKFFAGG